MAIVGRYTAHDWNGYRARGAVRDVGKVMGLSEDVTGLLASQV